MKTLTKKDLSDKLAHFVAIRQAHERLEQAVDAFNTTISELRIKVEAALEALNASINEAEGWREEVHTDQDSTFCDKSERWQESEAGLDYQDWMTAWDVQLEEVQIDFPDELEMPNCDALDLLESLPDEP
jgi:hypothetical protein